MYNYESKEERRKFRIRTVIISALLILNVTAIYLYYYVLIFNDVVPGKVYGESTFNGGRYEIYTLKYYYQHKGISYFDKIDYVMGQDLNLGDSIDLRVLRPYPKKHIVNKVYRDNSISHQYDCDDGFIIRYNAFIEELEDYSPGSTETLTTPNDNRIKLQPNTDVSIKSTVVQTIDNIRFNRGSIIDYYILKIKGASLELYSVYHYMNDFSTDAMPSKVIYHELCKKLPELNIQVSALQLDNPKKERLLDKNW
ncbi:hypothetical protein [Carboxylicivirga marina]|uniref:Uncharacterized protein n=1 Tax=Carboxylicivirga marina TaxID=2800988 RepID=A0ABS1HNP1_9BACT|nr:hypothetical protein [Carboxylicivirga marina]MBK3519310.1 hypothetical protein [Carboxylicivirga marina]